MGERERLARVAAENMLTASSSSHQQLVPPLDLSHSINSNREYYSADLVAGFRPNGRMSVVRRFFCLFVTFDLLFTFLMWLICIMLMGMSIGAALTAQIVHYSIYTSIFDIVMAAACRFTILLLFYALLYINHWCIIALTTSGTCAFLIAKVFVFDWATTTNPVFHVLLILTSFVLAWGEAWFLDFRVIPQELQAKEFLIAPTFSADSERTPLIRNYLQSLPRYDDYTESIANFYSPLDSPEGSDNEEDGSSNRRRAGGWNRRLSPQEEEYRKKGREVLEAAWRIINSDDWKLEKEYDNGDKVHSKNLPRFGKVYALTGILEFPPKVLLEELVLKTENCSTWNPSLLETRVLQKIDDHTEIIYNVSAEQGGGIVTSRDFILLQHWDLQDGCYVSGTISVPHASMPTQKKYIRGDSGPGCHVIQPIPGDPKKSIFKWLLNVNLKGWLPQYLVDTSIADAMTEYMEHLRKHSQRLKQEGRF